ncbi:MAG: bilirubin oxidase [Burkholderiaceae bacterium]|nr:bilirubin oxidase [Burkholderiaceae bacterium]
MNRRTFLRWGLTTGALLTLSACNKLLGQSSDPMQGHDMHSMGHDMSGGMMGGSTALLPVNALPTGAPLATLALLKNLSTEPNTFKANLTAKETSVELVKGKPTAFWTYNDQVPGPQIVVNEGDTVAITFRNTLSQPSTIHWHGLPVPPEQDGNPHDPVAPNAERVYTFTLPIGSAGTYWYHTHAHGYAAEQAFRGLAGSLIVKAKDDPLAHLPEQHLLFSDLRLDTDAQIPVNDMMDWMNGREGQFVLCNGQHQPKITITGTQRLRIWNACSARYLNLSVPNCEFIVVGTDGGLLEAPAQPVTELLIAPAERFEVIVRAKQSGTFPLQSLPYNRQKMMTAFTPETLTLASVTIQATELNLPTRLRTIANMGEVTAQKKVTFSEMNMNQIMGQMQGGGMNHNMSGMESMNGMSQPQMMMTGMFYINEKSFDMNRIDMTSKVGEVEEWLLSNNSHMDHPFHLHGTQFEIIEHINNGIKTPPAYRSRKDTVNLRPNEQVRIKTVQHSKGLRMFHCHILEHESVGMMAQLMVV